jgi:ribosomal-protein-alanine N-acetyltransferase
MDPLIRRLGTDDLEVLNAVEAESQPVPWTDDQMLLELVHEDARVFGVDDAQGLCGYIAIRRMVDELWVMNFAVHPRARRRGLGRRLLQAAIAHARAQAVPSGVWLEVRESNQAARALYQSMGFAEVSRRRLYYPPQSPSTERENAVVMNLAFLK